MFSNAYPEQLPLHLPPAYTVYNTEQQLDTLSKQRRLFTFLERLYAYQIAQFHQRFDSRSLGRTYLFFHGFGPTIIFCTLLIWAGLSIEAPADSLIVQAFKTSLMALPIGFCTTCCFTLITAGRLPWEPAWANRFCPLDPPVRHLLDQAFERLQQHSAHELHELRRLFDLQPTHALALWRSYQTVHDQLKQIDYYETLRSLNDDEF